MSAQANSLASRIMTRYRRTAIADIADPVDFALELGFKPDAWQAEVLRNQNPRMLLNCSRQSGKSTVIALKGLHKSLRKDHALILLLSSTQRQSGELFRKILDFWGQVDGHGQTAEAETKLTLELGNGSRIVSLPGKEGTIRGFSNVHYLAIDEAAKVLDTTYFAVRPMLAVSNGSLDAMATPFGKRGWWFNAWRSSENWQRFEIDATQCPRISPEFLAEEKRTMGEYWFNQEYMCQFADSETTAFRFDDVMAAIEAETVEEWTL